MAGGQITCPSTGDNFVLPLFLAKLMFGIIMLPFDF